MSNLPPRSGLRLWIYQCHCSPDYCLPLRFRACYPYVYYGRCGQRSTIRCVDKKCGSFGKMNDIDILIIDKTGTVTEGKPSVEKIVTVDPDYSEEEVLQYIVSLNALSEHPLAEATLKYGEKKGDSPAQYK